jgi:hypothetical protein
LIREIAAAAWLGATRLHQILKSPGAAEVAEPLSVLRELEWPAPEGEHEDEHLVWVGRSRTSLGGTSIALHSAGQSGRDQDDDCAEAPLASWSGYSGRLRRLLGRFLAGLSA